MVQWGENGFTRQSRFALRMSSMISLKVNRMSLRVVSLSRLRNWRLDNCGGVSQADISVEVPLCQAETRFGVG